MSLSFFDSMAGRAPLDRLFDRRLISRQDGGVQRQRMAQEGKPGRSVSRHPAEHPTPEQTAGADKQQRDPKALVGAEFFEGAARLFIEKSPPQRSWLDGYGEAFLDFLARLPEAAALDYLPDTARLEWAVNSVLHAPDAEPLDLRRLAELDASTLGDMHFVPNPAMRLVRSEFPVDAIWRAVLNHDDDALAHIDLTAGPVWLLVHRASSGIDIDRLSEWQWQFTAALLAGLPLHTALGATPPPDAHAWLATLLSAGCFTGFGQAQASDLPFPDLSP